MTSVTLFCLPVPVRPINLINCSPLATSVLRSEDALPDWDETALSAILAFAGAGNGSCSQTFSGQKRTIRLGESRKWLLGAFYSRTLSS